MPRTPRQIAKDSNLFKIDFDAIETVLADANARLLERSDELVASASRLPEYINGKDDVDDIKEAVQNIRAQIKEVSQARLSDGRPFSEAPKLVKNWFKATESKLKKIESILSDRLSDYASLHALEVERTRHKNEQEKNNFNNANECEEVTVGTTVSGDPVVSVNNNDLPMGSDEIGSLPDVPDVPLNWEVKSFDKSIVPLETLRQYFSDHSIRQALNKHLKDNGPNQLVGVEYIQKLGNVSGSIASQTARNGRLTGAQIEHFEKAGSPWTNEEDASLIKSFNDGEKIKELSVSHRRTNGAIRSRLVKLGLIDPST